MKNNIYGVLLSTLILFFTTDYSNAQSLQTERMVFAWKNMKNMVVNSAKSMPEENWDFVPVEGLRSFKDQIKHITTSNRFFVGYLAGEDNNEKNTKTLEQIQGKEEIIKDLEESFDYVIATLPKIKGFDEEFDMFGQRVTRFEAMMLTEHHLHREQGKITIYMRLKGVAPAKSTSWLL